MKTILLFFPVFLSLSLFGQNRYNMELTNFFDVIEEDGFKALLTLNSSKKPVSGIVYWESQKGFMTQEGPLLMEMSFQDGVVHGISKSWHENGKLMSIDKHKQGKAQGKSSNWYDNGQLWWITNYKNDQKQGYSKAWHKTGGRMHKKKYKNGILIKQICWDENGLEIKCD